MTHVQLYNEIHDLWQVLDTDTHRVIRAQKNYYDGIPELEMPKAGGREDRPHASHQPVRDQAQPLPGVPVRGGRLEVAVPVDESRTREWGQSSDEEIRPPIALSDRDAEALGPLAPARDEERRRREEAEHRDEAGDEHDEKQPGGEPVDRDEHRSGGGDRSVPRAASGGDRHTPGRSDTKDDDASDKGRDKR